MINGLGDLDYTSRLKALGLPSLQHRRRRADMLQVFKIFVQLEQLQPNEFFELSKSKRTRGHKLKLRKQRPRLDIRKNSFSNRVVNDWNSLPQSLIDSESIEQFKAGLDQLWAEHKYENPFQHERAPLDRAP